MLPGLVARIRAKRSGCDLGGIEDTKGSFNRFPGFNYEVQGVYQERIDDRIKFFTYAVRR